MGMTNEEAIKKLKNILVEASENDDSVCYVTSDDTDALKAAIKALEIQPCEDCISRAYIEPIIEELENICVNGDEYILSLLSNIKNAPSVTPSRSRGKWIHWTDDYKDYVTCSCCEYGEEGEVLLSDKTPFCPICGADMRGEDDGIHKVLNDKEAEEMVSYAQKQERERIKRWIPDVESEDRE